MANQATFGVAITADDKTAKGARSAEKRLGQIPKHASAVNRGAADAAERGIGRSSRSILRTLSGVEQASARVFGGRSMTSGITARLGAVREAASAAGTGFGEAATAGGVLEGAMSAVGVVAAGTIGILAAAGYAAFKLASGWAQGAASIGRTAETIGIATKALQEFNAAAERQGVDRATSTGAIAGLSQTLNDARYGRNNDAIALLSRLGVKLQTNADGTANTEVMLPRIADALQRQNSSGRLTAARILGIPQAALPAFTQGGAALGADMQDVDKTAYIVSDEDVAKGKRIQRKGAIVGQMKDRVMGAAGEAAAGPAEVGYDAVISGGRAVLDGTIGTAVKSFAGTVSRTFAPAAEKIERGGQAIARAAASMVTVAGGVVLPGQSHMNSRFGAREAPLKRDGTRGSSFHKGVDFRYATGTPVGAVGAGTVTRVGTGRGYGNVVEIDHGNGRTSFYAHLTRAVVQIGQKVSRGQEIALSGHSGGVAPHLHYEERQNGQQIDPLAPGGILAGAMHTASYFNNAGGLKARDGTFKRFASVTDSVREMAATLTAYQDKHGIDTIDGIVNRWAPKKDGNNTEAYASHVAGWTGHARGERLDLHDPATLAQLVAAIMRQEGNGKVNPNDVRGMLVEIKFANAPAGTHAKVTAGSGKRPAVSHAMQH